MAKVIINGQVQDVPLYSPATAARAALRSEFGFSASGPLPKTLPTTPEQVETAQANIKSLRAIAKTLPTTQASAVTGVASQLDEGVKTAKAMAKRGITAGMILGRENLPESELAKY